MQRIEMLKLCPWKNQKLEQNIDNRLALVQLYKIRSDPSSPFFSWKYSIARFLQTCNLLKERWKIGRCEHKLLIAIEMNSHNLSVSK